MVAMLGDYPEVRWVEVDESKRAGRGELGSAGWVESGWQLRVELG